jgi:chromosomal replication initiator protein
MPNTDVTEGGRLWQTTLPRLAERVGNATYDSFLRNTTAVSYDGHTFVLGVPTKFAKEWLEQRHGETIGACLAEVAQRPISVRMEVSSLAGAPPPPPPQVVAVESSATDLPDEMFGGTPLNPRYSFENFVVADCNRFAHAAALQVAKSPGRTYSPLFIHSKVGLGKTHLMQAIGHFVKRERPSSHVVYLSAESFVNQVITAIREGRMEELRRKHRYVDVWLVDDIQFIAAIEGPASEEEFFHTFNTLCETNKQVVLASDAPPRQLKIMNDRLRSRLEMGIVADLRAPDVETRVAILEKKAAAEEVEISRDVLEHVAQKIESNIRVLEGALLKICAHKSLYKTELTPTSVEEIIADYSTSSADRHVTLDEIVERVAVALEVSPAEITGPKRNREIVWPRQVAIYLSRELTDKSLAEIGSFFGGRDHSTVLHAYNKVSELITSDEQVLWLINDFRAALHGE